MLTRNILKNLEKELKERDEKIERLEKKNTELQLVFNDYIEKDLVKQKKAWPEGYLKQKEEHANALINLRMERADYAETMKKMKERYEDEIDRLKFEIEILQQGNKEPGFFMRMLKGGKN